MADFYRTSTLWVVDYQYDGRPRRWFRAFGPGDDVPGRMRRTLQDLYGERARLLAVRPASADEERQYLRGEEPKNLFCPTGRAPRREPPA